jgi:PhnB protein
VSTYLNFMGNTDEAFNFYRSVFGTEFLFPFNRIGDVPADENTPALSEAERRMVPHIELPILGGHVLMATDMIESMGHELHVANNGTINLEPDTRAETDRPNEALPGGGSEGSGPQDMFWGSY